MKDSRFGLALSLALLMCILPGMAAAQAIGVSYNRFEPAVSVDARPLQAQILVDGRVVGQAGALVGRLIQVMPGHHTVEVTAPGFHPYASRFYADSATSVSQFVVTLAPQ
jgi:hypothetical protein